MNLLNGKIYELDENNFALILRCLLDRIPIIIVGNDKETSEFFANKLVDFITFRNKLIFYTDFISKEELDIIFEEEDTNYDINRSVIICPNDAIHKALQIFTNFKSWILCIHIDTNDGGTQNTLNEVLNLLKKKIRSFLIIENILDDIKVKINGIKFKSNDLRLEKLIFNKSVKYVETSINRMQRIFSQRINSSNIKEDFKEELLNFNFEKNNLKNNIFKIKILEFYNATRRAFSILNKIKLLNAINIDIQLSDKTLMETISYTDASYKRIIEFIQAEWNENFNGNIESNEYKYKEDLIESLWG
ncbi:MAG: hypothetical protein ACTSRZ_00315 [Promethearchaeota archaeon]